MTAAEQLTRKLGPLPVWAWGLGAGVSINVARWAMDKKKAAAVPVKAATTDAGATAGDGAGLAGGAGSSPGAGVAPIGVTNAGAWNVPADQVAGTPTTKAGPQTNAEWQALSVEALQAEGYPPLAVETALSKYLAGNPITVAQQALVSIAFRHFGRPPEGAPEMTTAPDQPAGGTGPTPTPTAPPTPPPPAAPPTPAPTQTLNQKFPPAHDWSWLPGALSGVRFTRGSGPAVYDVTQYGLEWVPDEATLNRLRAGIPESQKTVVTIPNTLLYTLPRVGLLPSPDAYGDPTLGW